MATMTLQTLPPFDSGSLNGTEFSICEGDAAVVWKVEGRAPIRLDFRRVRWHEFTAVYNCTPEQVAAHSRLVEITNSSWAADFIAQDRASVRAYRTLRHYRIFIEEHGCHELLAESHAAR
jgi:hypothetical protein